MITSPDYTGTLCYLTHVADGRPVNPGDVVADFRGGAMTITGGRAPHHEASTGRVYTDGGEYFPGVANLEWRPVPTIADRVRAALPDGAILIEVDQATPARAAVLARREHPYHPYVVWSYYPDGAPGMHHGSYHATLDTAIDAYDRRRRA